MTTTITSATTMTTTIIMISPLRTHPYPLPMKTPVVLELGGKDAAILCEDADLGQAVPIIMRGTYQNVGQNCVGKWCGVVWFLLWSYVTICFDTIQYDAN